MDAQHQQRLANHLHSERAKAPLVQSHPGPTLRIDDLVYLHSDRNKSRARDGYIVISVEPPFCNIRKFVGSRLRGTSYRVRLSDCFMVPPNVPDCPSLMDVHTAVDSAEDEDLFPDPNPPPVPPAIPDAMLCANLTVGHHCVPLLHSPVGSQTLAVRLDCSTLYLPRLRRPLWLVRDFVSHHARQLALRTILLSSDCSCKVASVPIAFVFLFVPFCSWCWTAENFFFKGQEEMCQYRLAVHNRVYRVIHVLRELWSAILSGRVVVTFSLPK